MKTELDWPSDILEWVIASGWGRWPVVLVVVSWLSCKGGGQKRDQVLSNTNDNTCQSMSLVVLPVYYTNGHEVTITAVGAALMVYSNRAATGEVPRQRGHD